VNWLISLLQSLQKGGSDVFTSSFFEAAQKEIYTLMGRDSLQRFIETPQFLLCLIILQAAKDKGLEKLYVSGNKENQAMVEAAATAQVNKEELSRASKAPGGTTSQVHKSRLSKLPNRVVKQEYDEEGKNETVPIVNETPASPSNTTANAAENTTSGINVELQPTNAAQLPEDNEEEKVQIYDEK